jgi:hypothetical protein
MKEEWKQLILKNPIYNNQDHQDKDVVPTKFVLISQKRCYLPSMDNSDIIQCLSDAACNCMESL